MCLCVQEKHHDLEQCYQQSVSEVEHLRGHGQEEELQKRCKELSSENVHLSGQLEQLRAEMVMAVESVREGERKQRQALETEIEQLVASHSVEKDEVSSLRYQLSSTNMELQQTKEVCVCVCM